MSWRKAVHAAYEQFEPFEGSVKHYQAVLIIRNKIVGAADGTLTSFSTPLNFKAIISRLDSSYCDKTPLYILEQQLSVLRQGNLSVREYYDQVEIKLTLITNKTQMTYDKQEVVAINEKYCQDALRVFISGLNKSLSDTLFSSRPADLPSALALAEELEGNRERYYFAANFAKLGEIRDELKKRDTTSSNLPKPSSNSQRLPRNPDSGQMEPMDIDPSLSRVLVQGNQPGNIQGGSSRRQANAKERPSDRFRQKVNNLTGVANDDAYAAAAAESLEDDISYELESEEPLDNVHFLGVNPCFH